ncbi:MAG TPA: carbamoyltransferase C-terminal domain-containing protein [Kofleriaceae bacterium]|jgi:carbamoyltransferase
MRIIAFHVQHDAGVAVAEGGRLRIALELERVFEERYFECASSEPEFRAQWRRALGVLQRETGIERFDVAVTSWVPPSKRRILQELVEASEWRTVDHHVAHALHGFYDAPYEEPLVVSFDGGGNDGTFRLFRGHRRRGVLDAIARVPLNLGTPYRVLATAMPEVTGRCPQPRAGHLSLAGKLMAYAALASPRHDWLAAVIEYYRTYQEPSQALFSLGEALHLDLEADSLLPEDARALAATSQVAFEALLLETISAHLDLDEVDGLVLTGGCALNVVANERVRRTFGLPVHVPPAPNDAGIPVGALWSVSPPIDVGSPFVGPELIDDVDERTLRERGGRRADVVEIARLVRRGAVISIAQGRAELGPRALGHRSIVAAPDRRELRERINARIKSREWYRPVAPAVLASAAGRFFDGEPCSPYMSFAVPVRDSARGQLAGVVHVDGTARVQTIDDPTSLLGSLLVALESMGAAPCVLNTSFNVQARPLLQRASAALEALDTTEIDFAWINGWLVPRDADVARQFAEQP